MLTSEQIRQIREAVEPRSAAHTYIVWGLGALIAICTALATFELSRVSAGVERVEQRQLTQMLPGLQSVNDKLKVMERFCCSEIKDGKPSADVMIDDDPPKGPTK